MLDYEELEKIQKKLKKHMTAKRYRHTIGVSYTAVSLAMRYGVDLQQAAVAGLLHDCAKCLEEKQILQECDKYHISYNGTEAKQPYLLHAKLGALYASHKYKITDKEICSAIRYHTTGRADMTLLEKIIFTADYIEPHRKTIPGLDRVRSIAFEDLDEAVYQILRSTIEYLSEGEAQPKKEIEKHTLEAYEYYSRLQSKK
jgi:predicted HD superfamily hydrolase involved in NAD metabolism